MFCPSCGSQNSDTAQTCIQCALPMVYQSAPQQQTSPAPPPPMPAGPATSASVSAAAPAPAQAYPPLAPQEPEKTMSIFGRIGIVLVSILAIGFAFGAPVPSLPNESQAVGFRVGRLLAAILIPFLIAYLVAGRKKARNPNLFAGLFCGIGIFLLLAVRNPSASRSLIAFTAWSSLAHAAVMGVQLFHNFISRGELVGVALLGVIGVTLIALAPVKQPAADRAPVVTR